MTVELTDNSDARFAACLDNLESSEVSRRRQAIATLEQIGGVRALQVAVALTGDADQIVASSARRICSEAGKKGLVLRSFLKTQALPQTVAIKSFMQLLDEVVFIMRRNLAEVVRDSFLFSIPKFSLVTLFFLCPFYEPLLEIVSQPWLICLLIFIYEIFWRPLVWLSTGNAFLAGFPDNNIRRQSRQFLGRKLYRPLLRAGLVEAVLYALILSSVFWWHFNLDSIGALLGVLGFFWLIAWLHSSSSVPVILLRNKDSEEAVWLSGYSRNFWVSVKLGASLAVLYFVVLSSIASLVWLLGFAEWINGPIVFIFGYFIAADALIDPFVIGYRLLLTRLSMDPRLL